MVGQPKKGGLKITRDEDGLLHVHDVRICRSFRTQVCNSSSIYPWAFESQWLDFPGYFYWYSNMSFSLIWFIFYIKCVPVSLSHRLSSGHESNDWRPCHKKRCFNCTLNVYFVHTYTRISIFMKKDVSMGKSTHLNKRIYR